MLTSFNKIQSEIAQLESVISIQEAVLEVNRKHLKILQSVAEPLPPGYRLTLTEPHHHVPICAKCSNGYVLYESYAKHPEFYITEFDYICPACGHSWTTHSAIYD